MDVGIKLKEKGPALRKRTEEMTRKGWVSPGSSGLGEPREGAGRAWAPQQHSREAQALCSSPGSNPGNEGSRAVTTGPLTLR